MPAPSGNADYTSERCSTWQLFHRCTGDRLPAESHALGAEAAMNHKVTEGLDYEEKSRFSANPKGMRQLAKSIVAMPSTQGAESF
jgi:hypothetical protein